ncbi:MAG: cytochrome c oxidase subunit II [Polyangiales bacterium]
MHLSTHPAIELGTSFWMPKATSTLAPDVDWAFNIVLILCVIFFVGIVGAMLYFVAVYRRKNDDDKTSPVDHNAKIEFVWTVVPTVLVVWLFFVGFKGFMNATVAPAGAYEITVKAEKWNWTFTYPDGTVSPNFLAVPKGKPVKLIMSSTDVLHSFYVPEFRVKRDVIPGSYTTLWFEATEAKEVLLECAEYCGKGHSEMLGTVSVMEEDKFKEWLEAGGDLTSKGLSPVKKGEQLFTKWNCKTCHSVDGSAGTGPTLKGVFGSSVPLTDGTSVNADENYVRESILLSNAKIVRGFSPVMPIFKGTLKDKDVDALVAFIKEQK